VLFNKHQRPSSLHQSTQRMPHPTARDADRDGHSPTTLASLLRSRALQQPGAPALLAPGLPPLSYAGLYRHAQHSARHLAKQGATARTRVAVVLPNGPDMATAFVGVAGLAACAPLNPAYGAAELRFHLQDTRADFVLMRRDDAGPVRGVAQELGLRLIEIETDAGAPAGCFRFAGEPPFDGASPATAQAEPPLDPQADLWPGSPAQAGDIALLLHTSGTTARPKLVPLSQANLVASACNIAAHLALSPADQGLNVMPLFHIHGLVGSLLATLAAGGSVVCTPGFDEARFFGWVAEFEPSWYSAVPTMHQAVLAQADAYRALAPAHRFRFVRSSSAALPAAVLHRLQAALQAPVVEAYGMTEASHQMASNPVAAGAQMPGSVGVAAGVELCVLGPQGQAMGAGAVGEVAVRGAGVMRGYENNPQANAEAFHDGWFRTGDLGRLDAQGRLFIAGRVKEIVNRGGEKLSPREVDDALLEHPAVAQAAAFGVPHASLGEDLAAAVVLRAGAALDEATLRAFLFERLADFKVPSRIVFVERIPTGATGKVQRQALHQALGGALARQFVAPATPHEWDVESIFREVLGCGPVGVHDNFFALGGDSLRGARVVARVNALFGLNLPVIALFRHPSIAELVAALPAVANISASAEDDAALLAQVAAMSDEEVARMLAEAEMDSAGAPDPHAPPTTTPPAPPEPRQQHAVPPPARPSDGGALAPLGGTTLSAGVRP
jgi:acyl-CoA synthetase (AMP-forming)/AMP-acid ligase II